MSEAGYVHIHRTLLGHPAFRNDGEAMAFAWMVVRASWRPTRVRYKGQSVSLERGQLAISVRDLAEALDRPKGWVERLFARLKSGTMIETRAETGVTIITICNYNEYQAEQDTGGTPSETRDETDAGQTQDTEQRREKGKKEKASEAKASSAARAALKPDQFPCPEGCDPIDWRGLLETRKAQRKPMTEGAYRQILNKLEGWTRDGWPPGPILANAAEKGWLTVFETSEMKAARNGRPDDNPRRGLRQFDRDLRDGFERACDEVIERHRSVGAGPAAGADRRRADGGAGGNRELPLAPGGALR